MPETNSDTDLASRIAAAKSAAIPPISTNYQERVKEMEHGVLHLTPDQQFTGADKIDHLIASLGVATAAPDYKSVETTNPDAVNALVAMAADLKRRADMLTEQRDRITDALKQLVGEAEAITVHGATVFTYKATTSRVLDQAYIKKQFPDIPENHEFWTDQTTRRSNYK